MKMYARIFALYRTALFRTIRLLIFSFLLCLLSYQLSQQNLSSLIVFFFNVFVMIEIFFHYKVSRVTPGMTIAKNDGKDVLVSFTLPALELFLTRLKTSMVIKSVLSYPQIKALLQKADITQKDIVLIDVDKKELAKNAFEMAKMAQGIFVTTVDILLAYLLLTEEQTKMLFTKKLKTTDMQNIAVWIRNEFQTEEYPKPFRVRFDGAGIGEALVSGWTPETKKYTDNFTSYALSEEPLLIGRQAEFRDILEGVVKLDSNSVLLVGDIGAGKENMVRALAYQSFEGRLGRGLNYKRIFQLLVGPLTAGVGNRSDLEVRLQNIIAEISHANDVILYIPDFQNIVGASSYNLDLSGALLPYLKSGTMPVVATMTTGTYKTYMEHNPLKEAFTTILLKPPEKQLAIQMVMGEAKAVESKYPVILSYRSIVSAVELADRFLQDAALPGNAISLLEAVANSVALASDIPYFERTKRKIVLDTHVIRKVEDTAHVTIAMPQGTEKELLLHLEDKLHERVIDQNDAITAIAEAMRRVRSGMQTGERPVSFLFLGPTGVGKTETAKALAALYYGGEQNMIRLDMSEYTDESGLRRLLGAPPGAGDERGELTDKVHDHPAAIILLDEFEKAHPQIHNLFLQVLDDGRLTDNKGVTVSFRNSIIIATSNAGSEFIREQIEKGTVIDKTFQHNLLDYLETQALFKPELLNRFDDVITFKPLGIEAVSLVIKLLLKQLAKTLSDQDITLVTDDTMIAKIAKEGFDKDFGARPLRRYIQDHMEDLIAQKKLTNELTRGQKVVFSVDEKDNLQLTVE